VTPRRFLILSALFMTTLTMITVALVADASYGASQYVIWFDHSEGIFGPVGSTHPLGSVDIAEEDQGRDCIASVEVTNDSLWKGTLLDLESDGAAVQAPDVELVKGTFTVPLGHLVLGETANATLQLGSGETGDGKFPLAPGQAASSIAGTFVIECPDVPPTTTVPEPPAVSSVPPVTTPPAVAVVSTPVFTG
jgi:hypothetical protein